MEGVENVGQQMGGLGNKLSSIGKSVMGFGAKLTAGVSVPLAGLAVAGVKYNSTVMDLQTSFKVLLGSEEKATKLTAELKRVGAETPFEITGLAAATKTLLAFGIGQKDIIPTMTRLGDVSLGNDAAFQSLSRTFGQISALGKLQGGDLNQLIGQGWNPLNEITARTGETMEEVRKRMEAGKISIKEVNQALVDATSKGGKYFGGMAEGSKTLSGKISTMMDVFNAFLGEATKPLFDFLLEKGVPILTSLMEKFSTLSPTVKTVIMVIGGLGIIIPPLITGLGLLVAIIGGAVTGIGAIVGVIGTIGAPVLLLIPLLTGLAAVYGIVATAIIGVLTKTGALQWAFTSIKSIVMAIISVFQGDLTTAFDLLTEKFGMSKEQANGFIEKVVGARDALFRVVTVIKNVSALLGTIFTGKSQEMINLLMSKFGFTASEAKNFSNKVAELREKIIRAGEKFKEIATNQLANFITVIKKAAQFVYDHRKEIAMIIEKIIDFGLAVGKLAKKVYTDFKTMKQDIKDAMEQGKMAIDKVKTAFDKVKSAVEAVIKVLKMIVFPQPPKWLINKLSGFADGVRDFGGGMALVGERGPELVYLPKHSNVYSNQESKRMLSNGRALSPSNSISTTSNITNNYTVNADLSKVTNLQDLINLINNLKGEI
jgi:tape measure domain-containing protein